MSGDNESWLDGYVSEIGYTFDYHRWLNPLHMRLAFLKAGLRPPRIETACELGFGHGVSLVMHAAAGTARWYGNDINPDHVAYARRLADAAGVTVDLQAESFADFADRPGLPEFDYIAAHGVWSWISDRNREVIAHFVRQRLKPGGVFYVGYNALPGWTGFQPIRHLMTEHARRSAERDRSIVERIDDALAFARDVLSDGSAYSSAFPQSGERLGELMGEDRRYLAHEYFNRDWRPTHFAEMADALGQAGLSFACSANYYDAIDALNLEPAQSRRLAAVDDPGFRETLRDFIVNRRFRHDYWIKEQVPRAADRDQALRAERIVLAAARPEIPLKVRAVLTLNGQVAGSGPDARTIADVVAVLADGRPRTLADIETSLAGRATFAQIVETASLLMGYNFCASAQEEVAIAAARGVMAKLNDHLLQEPLGETRHLASPVLGGGIAVSLDEHYFLSARRAGAVTPEQWAQSALKLFANRPSMAGYPPRPYERDLGELTLRAQKFAAEKLPLLQALEVV